MQWTLQVLNNAVPNRQFGNYHINLELHYSKLIQWTLQVLNNVFPNRQFGNYHINLELHY